jgi:hypothetical protein
MILFIIVILPKKMRMPSLTWTSARCAQTNRLCMVDDKNGTLD